MDLNEEPFGQRICGNCRIDRLNQAGLYVSPRGGCCCADSEPANDLPCGVVAKIDAGGSDQSCSSYGTSGTQGSHWPAVGLARFDDVDPMS